MQFKLSTFFSVFYFMGNLISISVFHLSSSSDSAEMPKGLADYKENS